MLIVAVTSSSRSRTGRAAFDLDHHIFFWLTQVIGARDRRLAQILKQHGLRVPEWRTLAALAARRRCSMSELADLTTIDRTTLTRTVDRLQETGLIVRIADAQDLRVTRLALTAAGERLFARLQPEQELINQSAFTDLPPGAADMMRWTLARMKQNLEVGVDGESAGRSRQA